MGALRPRLHVVGSPSTGSDLKPSAPQADGLQGRSGRRRQPSNWPAYHDMVARVRALERAPVFFAVEPGARRALAAGLRRISIPAEGMVIAQGEPGDTIFILEQGQCRLVVERGASVVTIAEVAPGEFFGEGACVLKRPHPASVFASQDSTLLAIDRTLLFSVLGGNQVVLDELGKVAFQRESMCADLATRAAWGAGDGDATVVGVYSPKGGTGGTCLALNLVGSLAKRFPGQALLLDLDLPYAHSALLAGLTPTSSVARAAAAPAGAFEEVLLSSVLLHPAGLAIIAGALRPEEADEITADVITRAISILRRSFLYIVIDLGVAMNDATLAALDQTHHVVLVTPRELSGLKGAADAIDILEQLGHNRDRLTVVLNCTSPNPQVDRNAVEQTLKRAVDVEVRFDGSRPEMAAVNGTILSLTNPRSEITKGAEALVQALENRANRVLRGRKSGAHS